MCHVCVLDNPRATGNLFSCMQRLCVTMLTIVEPTATPEGVTEDSGSPYQYVVWAMDLVVHTLELLLARRLQVRRLCWVGRN